jgi:hypothetical protein
MVEAADLGGLGEARRPHYLGQRPEVVDDHRRPDRQCLEPLLMLALP